MNKVNYNNLSLRNVFEIIGDTLMKAEKIIIYKLLNQFTQQHISIY